MRSIASYQVHLSSDGIGALSLYSDWPFGFDEVTLALGDVLAGCYSLQSRLAMLRASDLQSPGGVSGETCSLDDARRFAV